ncbi:DUF5592 family protein [Priestia megaterium]|uniref:DUF5592 family protein n=1 Tax=Priestia megaterium TaxID=1404 RepID=UPI00279564A5|nr:DUF5592 family protein [Priestia megaterium]
MAHYNIPKEISSELKINKALYLFDLLLIAGILVFTLILNNLVHDSLKVPFYIFMGLIAVIMIWRPITNPKKRMYEVLIITLMRKRDTFCAIDRDEE